MTKTRSGAALKVDGGRLSSLLCENSSFKRGSRSRSQPFQNDAIKPVHGGNYGKRRNVKAGNDKSVPVLEKQSQQNPNEAIVIVTDIELQKCLGNNLVSEEPEPCVAKKRRGNKCKTTNDNVEPVLTFSLPDKDGKMEFVEEKKAVENEEVQSLSTGAIESEGNKRKQTKRNSEALNATKLTSMNEEPTAVLKMHSDKSSRSVKSEALNEKTENTLEGERKLKIESDYQSVSSAVKDTKLPVVSEVQVNKSYSSMHNNEISNIGASSAKTGLRIMTPEAVFLSSAPSCCINVEGKAPQRGFTSIQNRPHKSYSGVKHVSEMDLVPVRFASGDKYVGPAVSIAGGLWRAVQSSLELGGRAIGMFFKWQRSWYSKPLESTDAELFKDALKKSGISPWMVVPHGSYLLNCGAPDKEVLRKSRDNLIDELQRCEQLGLPIYNFHPGSSKGEMSHSECIEKIAESINLAHSTTKTVITVIENMCGQGNTIGGPFSELREIIDLVRDKSRMGVCLDTCHAFVAGYDIKSEKGYEEMKMEFERVIGRQYLRAVHLNDSKGKLGCNRDHHENIGKGELGLETFRRIMNDPFFSNVPMILRTPDCDYSHEIQTLYQLQDADMSS